MKTVVWTDGSCNANGMHGRGGWAALIEQAGTVREISGSADGTTHNRMELTAICEALETLTGAIEVRTDSPYVEKCFNQNWHERWLRDGSWKGSNGPVKNRDLWERLFGLVWDGSARRDLRVDQGPRGTIRTTPGRPARPSGSAFRFTCRWARRLHQNSVASTDPRTASVSPQYETWGSTARRTLLWDQLARCRGVPLQLDRAIHPVCACTTRMYCSYASPSASSF